MNAVDNQTRKPPMARVRQTPVRSLAAERSRRQAFQQRRSRIVVLVPPERSRLWATRLVEGLRRRFQFPIEMAQVPIAPPRPIPSEAVERWLFGRSRRGHSEWISTRGVAAAKSCDWASRVILNLTGHDPLELPDEILQGTVLSPLFEGRYEAEAMAGAVFRRQPSHLGVLITTGSRSRLLHGASTASPDRMLMPHDRLDTLLARMISLLVAATDHVLRQKPLPPPPPPPAQRAELPGLGSSLGGLAAVTLGKLTRKVASPLVRSDWCVAYRPMTAEAAPEALALDPGEFRILECPHDRFYADPFLFRHDGVTALFFEDFDHTLKRGRISHVVLGADGEHGPVTETLSRPYHLSYPFVFEHEGAVLMIPESSANGTVELYEAAEFPGRWRLRRVLIEGIEAADTTLHFDEATGLWWLFASVTEFGSCSHDTLSIFYSDQLEGPWRPHAVNPIKFDASSSRPAGRLIRRDGRLLRPAQDCTLRYGAGLTWCEIETLTPDTYQERVIARQPAPAGCTGLHTYDQGGGFETVDYERRRWCFARN